MRPDQLAERYPRLFHMAWDGSWENIKRRGLLSSQALVTEYGVSAEQRETLLATHRPTWVEIKSAALPNATIRDQKPMSDEGVRKALGGGDPKKWYRLLNSMVFFWPTKERLKTMMSARAYEGMRHDLLVVDTARLVETCGKAVRISPMNSGATKPFPHPRDFNLFKKLSDFPFDQRLKSHGIAKAVAEVCVLDRVDEIEKIVLDVQNVEVGDLDNL